MKKVIVLLLIMVMFLPNIFYKVEAKTINDLRRELAEIEAKENKNNQSINLTESEIRTTKNQISGIYTEINTISEAISKAEEDIKNLTKSIEEKDASTKALLASLQKTEGNSFYLEYLFGSETISDFVYRYAITEQITEYNSNLIKEMNTLIEENEAKKVELSGKQVELENKQSSLTVELSKLAQTKTKLYEFGSTLESEIKNARSVIQMYLDAGCTENEDINTCANKLLPPDTQFWRPMEKGYVTSEFGYRDAIYNSYGNLVSSSGLHEGIDLSYNTGSNTKLYAVANGVVAMVWYDQWGGNQVTIHHKVNGKSYSSSYAHMSNIYVKKGDIVTKDTQVGMMGSTGSATGPHLHIAISTGLRFTDTNQLYYYQYAAKCVNPRYLINLPSGERAWADRISYYK